MNGIHEVTGSTPVWSTTYIFYRGELGISVDPVATILPIAKIRRVTNVDHVSAYLVRMVW